LPSGPAGRSDASRPPFTASMVFSDGSPVTSFGITTWTMGRRPVAGAGGVGDTPPGRWPPRMALVGGVPALHDAAMASRLPPLARPMPPGCTPAPSIHGFLPGVHVVDDQFANGVSCSSFSKTTLPPCRAASRRGRSCRGPCHGRRACVTSRADRTSPSRTRLRRTRGVPRLVGQREGDRLADASSQSQSGTRSSRCGHAGATCRRPATSSRGCRRWPSHHQRFRS